MKKQKKIAFSFQDSDYEDKENTIQELLDESEMNMIYAVKAVHDSGVLSGIMNGERYLSVARVASYEKHKKDLQILKDDIEKI